MNNIQKLFNYRYGIKPDDPSFWSKYMDFILNKKTDEPLTNENVSRWHEEFVNSSILEDYDPKPLNRTNR